MIEEHIFLPRNIIVAITAHRSLGPAVRIVVLVAFATACQRLGVKYGFDMAVRALQRSVRAMQYVFRISVVVEPNIVKTFRHMAGVAALTEVALVIVVFAVACNAVRIHFIAKRIVAVTVVADQQGMFAHQVERRIPRVIERGVMPVGGLVAVSALLATAPIVCVVLGMAAEAGCRGFNKGVVSMTIQAAGRRVITDQLETGKRVVKRHILPADR